MHDALVSPKRANACPRQWKQGPGIARSQRRRPPRRRRRSQGPSTGACAMPFCKNCAASQGARPQGTPAACRSRARPSPPSPCATRRWTTTPVRPRRRTRRASARSAEEIVARRAGGAGVADNSCSARRIRRVGERRHSSRPPGRRLRHDRLASKELEERRAEGIVTYDYAPHARARNLAAQRAAGGAELPGAPRRMRRRGRRRRLARAAGGGGVAVRVLEMVPWWLDRTARDREHVGRKAGWRSGEQRCTVREKARGRGSRNTRGKGARRMAVERDGRVGRGAAKPRAARGSRGRRALAGLLIRARGQSTTSRSRRSGGRRRARRRPPRRRRPTPPPPPPARRRPRASPQSLGSSSSAAAAIAAIGTAGAADGTAGAPDAMCSHGLAPGGHLWRRRRRAARAHERAVRGLAPPRPPLRALSASEPFDEQRPRSSRSARRDERRSSSPWPIRRRRRAPAWTPAAASATARRPPPHRGRRRRRSCCARSAPRRARRAYSRRRRGRRGGRRGSPLRRVLKGWGGRGEGRGAGRWRGGRRVGWAAAVGHGSGEVGAAGATYRVQHRVVCGEGAEERRVGGGVEGGAVVGEVLARDLGEERADAAEGRGEEGWSGVVVEGAGLRPGRGASAAAARAPPGAEGAPEREQLAPPRPAPTRRSARRRPRAAPPPATGSTASRTTDAPAHRRRSGRHQRACRPAQSRRA